MPSRASRPPRVPKGDVLGTARLAGIMAAKRTAELIPLCHPLALTKLELTLELDDAASAIAVRATVEAFDRTGVEMEALTAVSVAALTVYDMLKGIDRAMEIGPTRLVSQERRALRRFHAMSLFEIRDSELSVAEVIAAVTRPEAGGIAVFVGTVRSENAGLPVTRLEYQAYASMAAKEMARIGAEIALEIADVRLAVLHRVGSLVVGRRRRGLRRQHARTAQKHFKPAAY